MTGIEVFFIFVTGIIVGIAIMMIYEMMIEKMIDDKLAKKEGIQNE